MAAKAVVKMPLGSPALSAAAAKVAAAGDYKAAALAAAGLVGYYPLDETDGPALDGSGAARNTTRSGVTYITYRQGAVLPGVDLGVKFTGAGVQNSGFTTPVLPGLGTAVKTGITVAFILETATALRTDVVGCNNDTAAFRVQTNCTTAAPNDTAPVTAAGKTCVTYKLGGTNRALAIRNSVVYDGNPHLIVAVLKTSGRGSGIWVDGVLESQVDYSLNSTFVDGTTPVELAGMAVGNFNANGTLASGLSGTLRGVAFWTSPLTAAQIRGLYNAAFGAAL